MARVQLDLTPQHFRRGRRGNPGACLLEKAAEDQHGIKLRVGGTFARERRFFFPRTWSLDGDAQQVVSLFDSRASQRDIFRGRRTVRVHLNGPPLRQRGRQAARDKDSRPASRGHSRQRPGPLRATAGITAVASLLLIADGLAWIVITAASLAVAALATFAGARIRAHVRAGRTPDRPAPARTPPDRGQDMTPGRSRGRGTDFASGWDGEPYRPSRPEQPAWRGDPEPEPAGANAVWPHAPAMAPDAVPWRTGEPS